MRWQLFAAILGLLITVFWIIVPFVRVLVFGFAYARGMGSLLFIVFYFGFWILMVAIPTWKLFKAVRLLRQYRYGASNAQDVIRGQLSIWRTTGYIALAFVLYCILAILYSLFFGFGFRPY